MDECVRKMTLDEAIENARKVVNNCHQPLMTFETMNSIVKDNCREEHEQLAQWLEELKEYKELEEKLCVMFAGDCSLSDVVENLERQITEPGKDHPMNARILTYEDAEKWNEYRELEEQGRLLKLPCKIGDTLYVPTRNFISELRVVQISVGRDSVFFHWMLNTGIYPNLDGCDNLQIGKSVFLTKEEAEARLKEMETSTE